MYQIHDVVVSLVDNPEGASRHHLKDKVGVVTGIQMIGGEQCYQIIFQFVKDFLFNDSELRYATDQEIRNELIRILDPRKD